MGRMATRFLERFARARVGLLHASADETAHWVDAARPGRRFSLRVSSLLRFLMVPKYVGGNGSPYVQGWLAQSFVQDV